MVHGGLLRVFYFTLPIRGLGMPKGFTPRHAQTAGDLGFNVKLIAETLWPLAILRSDNSQSNISKISWESG